MNNYYSVIFDGKKIPDHEIFGVKQRLRELFKADSARIETLFTDKPVALKRNLSHESAIKYQYMLKKAGIEVALVQTNNVSQSSPIVIEKKPADENTLFSLAPLGSDLIPSESEKHKGGLTLFRTDHLELAPQEGNLVKHEELEKIPPVDINSEALDWELSQEGEDLLQESEKKHWQKITIDTSGINLDDSTKPLAPTSKVVKSLIKTDHLKLRSLEESEIKN